MRSIESIFREIESVPDFMFHTIDSVDYRNGYGDTPLHIVSYWGDCEAITTLVEAGADINAVGESGYTPLHCAAEANQPAAISLLLRLGAKVSMDSAGDTALDIAVTLNNEDSVSVLNESVKYM
jgi:uncharacterized protein